MKTEAWRVVFTGLSLTCVTATALFVLVAVNPKDAATYGSTPAGLRRWLGGSRDRLQPRIRMVAAPGPIDLIA